MSVTFYDAPMSAASVTHLVLEELGPKRGAAMKWIVWANASLGEAVHRIEDLLNILDHALAERAYLAGPDYTLADTHVHAFTGWLGAMKLDHIAAWSAMRVARPAYGKVMAHG